MAYDETKYLKALEAADAAGDDAGAQEIASIIKYNRAQGQQPQQAPQAPAAPVQTPEQAAKAAQVEQWRQEEKNNNFGQNALAGALDVVPDLYRGASQASAEQRQQLASDEIMGINQPTGRLKSLGEAPKANAAGRFIEAGDQRRELNKEELANRERMQFIDHSWGGLTGNIAANIALTAPLGVARGGMAAGQGLRALTLGKALAKTAPVVARAINPRATATAALLKSGWKPAAEAVATKVAPSGLELLGKNLVREGGTGALTGAATPTVEGESRGNNALTQAGFGMVMPLVGGAVASKPAQATADWVLANTPGVVKSTAARMDKAARKAYDEQFGPIISRNKEEARKFAEQEAWKVDRAKKVNEARARQHERNVFEAEQKIEADDLSRNLGAQENSSDFDEATGIYNADAKAAHAQETAAIQAAHAAEVEAAKNARAKAVADARAAANQQKADWRLTEANKAATAKQLREGDFDAARNQLYRDAGFENNPVDVFGAKDELNKVGDRLGEIVKPYPVATDTFVEQTKQLGKRGLNSDEAKILSDFGEDAHELTDALTGKMPGSGYSTMRRKIIGEMSDARPEMRGRLEKLLKHLDDSFDAVAPKETVDALKIARGQYTVGRRIVDSSFKATTGEVDPASVLRRLAKVSTQGDPAQAGPKLSHALRNLTPEHTPGVMPAFNPAEVPPLRLPPKPEIAPPNLLPKPGPAENVPRTRAPDIPAPSKVVAAKGEAPVPTEVPAYEPIRPNYDQARKMAIIASIPSFGSALAFPLAAAMIKAGGHKVTRREMARVLRAFNAGHGSVMAPGGKDDIPLDAPVPEKNIVVTHGKK